MSGIWSARDPGMPSELYVSAERVAAVLVGVLNVVIGYAAYGLERPEKSACVVSGTFDAYRYFPPQGTRL